MKKTFSVKIVMLIVVSIFLTAGAGWVAAQGPAGAGAAAVVAEESSHSYNPLKWGKKDSGDSTEISGSRGEREKKLTPSLQSEGVLAANATATEACSSFVALDECLAVLHASHNLGMDFNCLRGDVTGVHTSADMSGCKVPDEGKAQCLNTAIHQLKPDADAKQAAKDAEQQAKDDLKGVGG